MKLTDPHDHPEPHTMKWTQVEMDYINNRIETAVRQALANAALDKMANNERELGIQMQPTVPWSQELESVWAEPDEQPAPAQACNHDWKYIGSKRQAMWECTKCGMCKVPDAPPECKTEAEKTAFAFGWFKALESVREQPAHHTEQHLEMVEQADKFCDANCVWSDHHPDCVRAEQPAPAPAPAQEPVAWRELLREARDNCKASIVEEGISASRKEYRIDLEARLTAALNTPPPAPAPSQEPVGEITAEDMGRPFNAIRIGTQFYKEVPPVGTKLYTTPPAPAQPLTDNRMKVKLGSQYGADLEGHWFYLQPADEFAEAALVQRTGITKGGEA